MKQIMIFLIPAFILVGCKAEKKATIKGSFPEKPKQEYIYLNRVEVNSLVFVDSAKIHHNGHFAFKLHLDYPDFFQLGFSDTEYANLLIANSEKVIIKFNDKTPNSNFSVQGSTGTEQILNLDRKLLDTKMKLKNLSMQYDSTGKDPSKKNELKNIEKQYTEIIKEQRRANISFIVENSTSLACINALYQQIDDRNYVLYKATDLQYKKIVSDSLSKYYPQSKQTKALVADFNRGMKIIYQKQLNQLIEEQKKTELNPDLTDITGKRVKLSSLKGKYVLLSFWSAGSKDCIAENLQLKSYYDLYHKKGFEIYQINIDSDEALWRTAVKFDELPWINVREDPSDPYNVLLYNVKSLPANYFYDKEGEIVASNLHGKQLKIKLEQVFQ